ncbi:hypothetical protein AAVH_39408, partial [Aphelenchoides avenae]
KKAINEDNGTTNSIEDVSSDSEYPEYPNNDTFSLNLTNSAYPASSLDYVIGNNTETVKGPSGSDYPEYNTDRGSTNFTDVDPVGNGVSLETAVNVSANTGHGSNDYYWVDPEELPSESEDVLDSSLTSAKGAYHVAGKVLYTPGDQSWRILLKIEHSCHNGTIE